MFNVDIGEINPLASCCTDRLMELHNSNAIIGRKQELAHFKVVSYAPFGYAKWQRWSIVSHGEPRAIISYDDDDDKTWLLHVYRVERVQHERKRTWWGPCVFLSRHSVKAPKWSLSLSLSRAAASVVPTQEKKERKKPLGDKIHSAALLQVFLFLFVSSLFLRRSVWFIGYGTLFYRVWVWVLVNLKFRVRTVIILFYSTQLGSGVLEFFFYFCRYRA